MNIHEKLMHIQQELNVPKGRKNPRGFSYRNLEDIMISVKPLLKKYECVLTFSDTIMNIDGDSLIFSTAKLSDSEGHISCQSQGGIDPFDDQNTSQAIGAGSSYARKYAAGGLFLLDDNQDADSAGVEPDESVEEESAPPTRKSTKKYTPDPEEEEYEEGEDGEEEDAGEEEAHLTDAEMKKLTAWVKKNAEVDPDKVVAAIKQKYASRMSTAQKKQIAALLPS